MKKVWLLVARSVATPAMLILGVEWRDFNRFCLEHWGVVPASRVMDGADILAELRNPPEGELVVGILPKTDATDEYATFGWLEQEPPVAIVLNIEQQGQEGVIEALNELQ
ncbi:MAG: hypothetical protein ABIJ72_03590 [bacterium]